MAGSDHDISTLNSLIATTLDSVEGYQEAAKNNESHRFTGLFTARASERRQVASDLQAEVTRVGGTPADGGTALGGAHRMFLNLKSLITGNDDQAIVNEVEAGEDHIKAKFEAAMKDDGVSPVSRLTIEKAFTSVRAGHDQMRDLKHNLQTAN